MFLQSNVLEWPVYLPALRHMPRWRGCLFITSMNAITHPIVFHILMRLPFSRLQNILVAEAFAISAETLILWRYGGWRWPKAAVIALIANLLSWQLGPVLTYFVWL
ncbi:MAG: hypothetical protein AB7G93_10865 [Bdellovibrionales bacterium]